MMLRLVARPPEPLDESGDDSAEDKGLEGSLSRASNFISSSDMFPTVFDGGMQIWGEWCLLVGLTTSYTNNTQPNLVRGECLNRKPSKVLVACGFQPISPRFSAHFHSRKCLHACFRPGATYCGDFVLCRAYRGSIRLLRPGKSPKRENQHAGQRLIPQVLPHTGRLGFSTRGILRFQARKKECNLHVL
jgi:hypothetical protein